MIWLQEDLRLRVFRNPSLCQPSALTAGLDASNICDLPKTYHPRQVAQLSFDASVQKENTLHCCSRSVPFELGRLDAGIVAFITIITTTIVVILDSNDSGRKSSPVAAETK